MCLSYFQHRTGYTIFHRRGFTLIELMVVVAVIGVLSSIALPQYQNYIKKSQLGAALATLVPLKINIEEQLISNGSFPSLSATEALTTLGATASSLGSISSKKSTSGNYAGQLILTLNSSTQFSGNKLTLSREENGNWSCVTDIQNTQILPKQCSNGNVL